MFSELGLFLSESVAAGLLYSRRKQSGKEMEELTTEEEEEIEKEL